MQIPDQRVSSHTKMTDKAWFIQMSDFVIDLAMSSCDKYETKRRLAAANGNISKKDYNYVLSTYMSAEEANKVEKEIESIKLGKLRDVDILSPIKKKYMGEFINSYHNYQVYSQDPETVSKRNAELGSRIKELAFGKLAELMQNTEDPSKIDIQKEVDTTIAEWKDRMVEDEQHALELLNSTIEAKRKYIDAYFYWWATEEVYTYRRISGNDVLFEVVPVTEYYRVDSGNYFVEDDHYGLRRYTLTIPEIIDYFYNGMEDGLTEKQLKFLKDIVEKANGGIGSMTPQIFKEHQDLFKTDASYPNADIAFTRKELALVVNHGVFKTEIPKYILTYIGPDLEQHEMDVDEDYVMNPKYGDISLKKVWIDQMWEFWRFNDDHYSLYIPPRPVEIQRELISNTSVCKSPYNGISYINKDNDIKPVPMAIKDYIVLYKIYTLLEERALAKFKSWLAIPESVLDDSEELSAADRLQQADADGIFPYNNLEKPMDINGVKEVATQALVNYIQILNQVKISIKQEAWELADMNESRFGANNQYKGKAVSEYDYNQAIKGTVWSLEMFNSFRERDYQANLDYSRVAWVEGKQGSYIDPNDKTVKYVNISGDEHLGANIGIDIVNSTELNQQAMALRDIAFAASQNGDHAMAAEAVTNKNISSLKNIIREAQKAQREYDLKIKTASDEIKRQTAELELADNREQREHEMALQDSKNQNGIDIAIIQSETDLEIEQARLQLDANGNGYISEDEAARTEDGISRRRDANRILQDRKNVLDTLKENAKYKNERARRNNKNN